MDFHAPLNEKDTATQTVGCRAHYPDICANAYMAAFVKYMGWTTFDEMMKYYDAEVVRNDKLKKDRDTIFERKAYLEDLLYEYSLYEPYIENHKEQWALKGFARKKYEREHFAELE